MEHEQHTHPQVMSPRTTQRLVMQETLMTDVRAGRVSPYQALGQLLAASQAQVSPRAQPATQLALPTSIPAL
eukprot:7764455-Pyramimonas_sp.AAC.1